MSASSAKTSPHYLPALDGFRGAAILLVLLSHAGMQKIVPGGLGVLIFFVISGFLITRQMIAEIETTRTLNIKQFYLRRFFRLTPALIAYVIGIGIPLLIMGSAITLTHILSALFYFANYYFIFHGYPPYSPMPILWSLSVEEHFYILFPFCLMVFRKNLRRILPWLFAAVLAALIWRNFIYFSCLISPWALCGLPGKERYFGTDMIFDCILYGSIAALLMHYYKDIITKFFINRTAFFLSTAGLIISLLIRDDLYRVTSRFTLQSICVAIFILNTLYGNWRMPEWIFSNKVLTQIGQLSYSLYLFHYGVLVLMNALRQHQADAVTNPQDMLIYLAGSFFFASLSYHFVEKPMLKVRRRFGAHPCY